MDKTLNDDIVNTIEEEISKQSYIHTTNGNDENKDDNGADEVYLKLDPIENIAECMAVSVEGLQIHYGIMQLIKLENIFSEETRDMKPEEIEKVFTDECIKIYNKKSLLLPYMEKVITNIMEDPAFNYSKKLPRLLLMSSYYKKKKNHDPTRDGISYYKLTEVDEDGNYTISKNFEKVIKSKSIQNIEFAFDFIVSLWTKRMTEQTSLEVLKKKILKFLKTKDYMETLKMQLDNYLIHQQSITKEKEHLRQQIQSEHTKLRKG